MKLSTFALVITSILFSFQVINGQQPLRPEVNSPWNEIHYTALSHPIAFPAGVLSETGILPGDIIGVFTPEGLCAGFTTIDDVDAGVAVIAFANDHTTGVKDGFEAGELFHFKLYSQQLNQELDLWVEFDDAMPNTGQFEIQGISSVTSVSLVPTSVNHLAANTIAVYPNPSDGMFSLAMQQWPDDLVIYLTDASGRTLHTVAPGPKLNGSSYQFQHAGLRQGVYFLKMVSSSLNGVQKVVIR